MPPHSSSLTIKIITNFPKKRYNLEELLDPFNSKEIKECNDDFYISFEIDGDDLEIYFPNENGIVNDKYIEKARRILTNIDRLDNLVQESCEL